MPWRICIFDRRGRLVATIIRQKATGKWAELHAIRDDLRRGTVGRVDVTPLTAEGAGPTVTMRDWRDLL